MQAWMALQHCSLNMGGACRLNSVQAPNPLSQGTGSARDTTLKLPLKNGQTAAHARLWRAGVWLFMALMAFGFMNGALQLEHGCAHAGLTAYKPRPKAALAP